jgi:hypothetical protein
MASWWTHLDGHKGREKGSGAFLIKARCWSRSAQGTVVYPLFWVQNLDELKDTPQISGDFYNLVSFPFSWEDQDNFAGINTA